MPHSKTVDVGHVRHESATTPLTAALAPKAPGERWTQALRWGLPGGRALLSLYLTAGAG